MFLTKVSVKIALLPTFVRAHCAGESRLLIALDTPMKFKCLYGIVALGTRVTWVTPNSDRVRSEAPVQHSPVWHWNKKITLIINLYLSTENLSRISSLEISDESSFVIFLTTQISKKLPNRLFDLHKSIFFCLQNKLGMRFFKMPKHVPLKVRASYGSIGTIVTGESWLPITLYSPMKSQSFHGSIKLGTICTGIRLPLGTTSYDVPVYTGSWNR